MTRGERPESEGTPAASPTPRVSVRISDLANQLLEQWSEDLLLGRLEVWHLPPGLQIFYDRAFCEGLRTRQPEIDAAQQAAARANAAADRYYRHAYAPHQQLKPAPASYAEMERLRGNPERAEQYEQFLEQLFSNFGGNSPTPPPKNGPLH